MVQLCRKDHRSTECFEGPEMQERRLPLAFEASLKLCSAGCRPESPRDHVCNAAKPRRRSQWQIRPPQQHSENGVKSCQAKSIEFTYEEHHYSCLPSLPAAWQCAWSRVKLNHTTYAPYLGAANSENGFKARHRQSRLASRVYRIQASDVRARASSGCSRASDHPNPAESPEIPHDSRPLKAFKGKLSSRFVRIRVVGSKAVTKLTTYVHTDLSSKRF